MSAAVGYISILQVNGVDLPVSSDVTDQDWRRRSRRSAEKKNTIMEERHTTMRRAGEQQRSWKCSCVQTVSHQN